MGLNIRAITKICSLVTVFIGALTFVPVLVSLIYKEFEVATSFVLCASSFIVIGSVVFFVFRKIKSKTIRARDAIITVSLVWVITILLGTITLAIVAKLPLEDAFFESASGFTTTGATVITDIESLPYGLMFYRSFSHWVGGLGIILLVILVLPMLGAGAHIISQAETSSSMSHKIFAKYTDTAKRLFMYYTAMTIACTFLLWLGKMDFFDSLIHTMGTVSTGGFSNYNTNVMENVGMYEYWIMIIFMIFGSVNFTLYYYLFSPHWKDCVRDTELRWYMSFLLAGSVLVSFNVFYSGSIESMGEAITHGTFNLVSTISTTGLSSYDTNLWPSFSKMIILTTMLIGGCSASTSGGVKAYRVVVAFKLIKRNITRRLHPYAHVSIKSDDGPMRADFVSAVAAFIFLYIVVIFASSILLAFENKDFLTTVSGVMSCMGNVGTGFSEVGASGSFANFSPWGKIVLSLDMIVGRLEMFGIIMLFTANFWNVDRFRV